MTAAMGGPGDGRLFGTRREGPVPKLVVVGIAWAAFGVVALIAAVLLHSVGVAVFGVLGVLAGGGLYLGQRARERIEFDEEVLRADRSALADDFPLPDDEDAGDDPHDTRVMSTSAPDRDDIIDAEYTEYDPSPADQDDGTGYDDDEIAYRRRRADQWARESRAHEQEATRVTGADSETTDSETTDRADDETDRAPDRDDDGDGAEGSHRSSGNPRG